MPSPCWPRRRRAGRARRTLAARADVFVSPLVQGSLKIKFLPHHFVNRKALKIS
ncbi:hypothetical protein NEIELOOT_00601 [Neisseria elongata subsp. glycolytica ATCC 29315]|uniref:Uncharacterized protein n=1 Tax=Neisseria elongata subsp. glycolytica ATCC 29315 TaxID=546263 RepID=D4DNH1_NEIEG|nr:hypothetical protein NEIELOOT_00601 [Neisseria elongata subsp. glycolytica ATCC 29315]